MGDNSVMSFDPGRVRLSIETGEVACARPAVARLLCGQPAEQAVALVPLIYSLCGKAQGIAARAALSAALGEAVAAHVDAEAWAEAAREHAWKLFVDWPKQLGQVPDEAFFVRLMRSQPDQRQELAAALAVHPLPQRLRDTLHGGEIAALFAGRLAIRLAQLADWLEGTPGVLGTLAARATSPQTGESRIETARGTLVHRLELAGDRIADYAIIAPTDVHFAAGGDAAAWLEKVKGLPRMEAERQALLLVLAFDPCVPWELA
jgi:coenzyme F420-reducing hydrogenase alpha subunit